MKVKIAAIKYVEPGSVIFGGITFLQANPDGTHFTDTHPNYLRLTEWTDVELPDLPKQDLVSAQVSALDEAERELRRKFADALSEIGRRRQELIALPAPV